MRWPLVGRERERERCRAVLSAPGPHAVAILGPSGVGKSRLLTELAADAEVVGWTVERVHATPSTATIPFGAVAQFLGDDPAGGRLGLLKQAERTLTRGANGDPLLLAVDDAHHLDDGSAALVERLLTGAVARVVLTCRSEPAPPEFVAGLCKDGFAARVPVEPLDRADTRRMVTAALEAPVDDDAMRAIWRCTRGHPLFVRLAVETAVEAGALAEADGCWSLVGDLDIPPAVHDLVAARITPRSAAARATLDVVAVGAPVPERHLHDLAESHGREGLDELIAHGLVVHEDTERVAPAHPLYGEVVLQELGSGRRAELTIGLADRLRHDPLRRRGDLVRAASWLLDAGEGADPEFLVAAAEEALALVDFALAERIARAALAADDGHSSAWFALAQALRHQGWGEEAHRAFTESAARAVGDADRVAVAIAWAHSTALVEGDFATALRMFGELAPAISDREPARRLAIERAFLSAVVGDYLAVVEAAPAVLDDPSSDDATLLSMSLAAAFAGAMTCRTAGLDRIAARGTVLADRLAGEIPLASEQLRLSLAVGWVAAGRVDAAIELATAGRERAQEQRSTFGVWAVVAAFARTLTGDLATAVEEARAGAAALEHDDPLGFGPVGQAIAALVHAQAGGYAEARRLAAEAPTVLSEADRHVRALVTDRVAAWLTTNDDREAAAGRAADAGRRAVASSHRIWGVLALHDAVRLGQPGIVVDDLAELTAVCDGDLVPALHDHAVALHAGDPAGLLRAAGALRATGARLLAAEAAAQAAAAYADRGDRPAAARAATVAGALLVRGTAPTPALRDAPDGLTPRELDVVRRAVGGATSAEIAAELVLSVRTVDNHLGRAYRKLAVAGRDELGAVLGPHLPGDASVE